MNIKNAPIILIFFFITLTASCQKKNIRYFNNPVYDYKEPKNTFNGIRYSAIFADDITLNGWSEFKIGWYQKNNKIFGFHPNINIGYFYDFVSSDEPFYDNPLSNGLFLETGISTAFHFIYCNIKFNNYLKKYFELKSSETKNYHDEYIYIASFEQGFYFDRFELNAELGLSWNLSSYMEFYGIFASINFGVLLESMKY